MTASETRPPALPRRSSRTPAPAGAARTASRTRGARALGEGGDLDHRGAVREAPDGHRLGGAAWPASGSRSTRAGPRSRPRTTRGAGVVVAAQQRHDLGDGTVRRPRWPSMVRSRSPGRMPALSAGPPDWTRATSTRPSAAASRPEADAGVLAVEGLLELLVLALVVDRAPAVAAAADDLLGRLRSGLAVGHGLGRGTRHVVAVDGRTGRSGSQGTRFAVACHEGRALVAAAVARTLAKTNVRAAPRRMRRGRGQNAGPGMAMSLGQAKGAVRTLPVRRPGRLSHLEVLAQREESGHGGHQQTDRQHQRKLGDDRVPADEVRPAASSRRAPGRGR